MLPPPNRTVNSNYASGPRLICRVGSSIKAGHWHSSTRFDGGLKSRDSRVFVLLQTWSGALEGQPGVDGLLEYEASANLVPFEDPVVCAYDLEKFGGDVVVDVMRTHPLIIIGGILQENPFFVPPHGFLRELRERRGPRQAASSVEDRRPV